MEEKTNVMRLLDAANASYAPHYYDGALSGVEVANALGQEPERVFKTLVTRGKSGHYVFVIPAPATLDLKKAARAAGEKFIEMIPQKDLLPLTGYIHGGCSPVGMKKKFLTFIDETAILYDTIYVSAGKVGAQIEVSLDTLAALVAARSVDLIEV